MVKALRIKLVLPAATPTILTLLLESACRSHFYRAPARPAGHRADGIGYLPTGVRLKSGATRGDKVLAPRPTARHLIPACEPLR